MFYTTQTEIHIVNVLSSSDLRMVSSHFSKSRRLQWPCVLFYEVLAWK